MKRVLLFLLIAFALIFAGCGEEEQKAKSIDFSGDDTYAEPGGIEEFGVEYYVDTESTPLSIREKANVKSKTVGYIPRGANITIDNQESHFGHVNYRGREGWVNLEYCTEGHNENEGQYYVSTERDPLSFREGPSRDYEILDRIPRGSQIMIYELDSSGQWAMIHWNGLDGWVSMQYATYGATPSGYEAPDISEDRVFVLISDNAEVYHKYSNCSGLDNADPWHELREVSLKEAINMGRRPCKICY